MNLLTAIHITKNMTIPILTNKESDGTNEKEISKPNSKAEVTENEPAEIKPNPRFEEIPNDENEPAEIKPNENLIQEAKERAESHGQARIFSELLK